MAYQRDTTDWSTACPRTFWTPSIKRVWTFDGSPYDYDTQTAAETAELETWGDIVHGTRGTICG